MQSCAENEDFKIVSYDWMLSKAVRMVGDEALQPVLLLAQPAATFVSMSLNDSWLMSCARD